MYWYFRKTERQMDRNRNRHIGISGKIQHEGKWERESGRLRVGESGREREWEKERVGEIE